MAASSDTGSEKYWLDGLPDVQLPNSNDSGCEKFWLDGLPEGFLFPPTATGTGNFFLLF